MRYLDLKSPKTWPHSTEDGEEQPPLMTKEGGIINLSPGDHCGFSLGPIELQPKVNIGSSPPDISAVNDMPQYHSNVDQSDEWELVKSDPKHIAFQPKKVSDQRNSRCRIKGSTINDYRLQLPLRPSITSCSRLSSAGLHMSLGGDDVHVDTMAAIVGLHMPSSKLATEIVCDDREGVAICDKIDQMLLHDIRSSNV